MDQKGKNQLNDLIDLIYDFDQGESRWHEVTNQLSKTVSADAAVLFRQAGADTLPVTYGNSFELDEAAIEAYSNHYYAIDEFSLIATHGELASYRHHSMHKVLGKRVISQSEWYNDFYLPLGYQHLGAVLLGEKIKGKGRLSFAHMREIGGSDFRKSDASVAIAAGKHIDRAISMEEKLASHQQTLATLTESFDQLSFGVLLVDNFRNVLSANHMALEILNRNDGLSLSQNKLTVSSPQIDNFFEFVIANAKNFKPDNVNNGVRMLKVSRRGINSHYQITMVPGTVSKNTLGRTAATATLFIFDGDNNSNNTQVWISELFGLTAAQSDLVASLLRGFSLNEHAELRGITKNTARSTLKDIFVKTNTSSQNQLLERVLRSPIGTLRLP